MTARWYSAWILCLDIAIVVCTYGLWLTLTLTGRLNYTPNDPADIPHKHSMTGLNLSGGNGVLNYEDGLGATGMGGSPPTLHTATRAGNKQLVHGMVQRTHSNGQNNINGTTVIVEARDTRDSRENLDRMEFATVSAPGTPLSNIGLMLTSSTIDEK